MAHPLTTGSSLEVLPQYTTGDIQPTASALVLAFVANARDVGTPANKTLATPEVSGNGLTWQRVTTVATPDGNRRLSCFRALGAAPTSSAAVISFGDQRQGACAWSIIEYSDVDVSGSNGAGAIAQSLSAADKGRGLTATLTPSDSEHGRTVGAVMLEPTLATQPHPVSAGTGFSEIHEQTVTSSTALTTGMTLQTQDSTSSASTIAWTWEDNLQAAALVVEIRGQRPSTGGTTPPISDPTEALIRRFEPVLHLHPDESFFPVNAKEYVESAALWAAKAPFDNKTTWGTAPLVKAGQLTTSPPPAPGEFLGNPDLLGADDANERFLELGGWKDQNQNHEENVGAATTNLYADRKKIVDIYNAELVNSKFWYHAELFDTAHLTRLAGTVSAPALAGTLGNFKNPALLCYYLFYPAHEESVAQDRCPNVEAKEVACHAGDWHCIALLLEGDGTTSSDKYLPRFFGITGSRPTPATDGGKYRPYAFDAEGRTTMKVEAWRSGSPSAPVQPDVVGDHPRFYVARGSHSMYATPGEHEVSPFDDANRRWGAASSTLRAPCLPPRVQPTRVTTTTR